MANNNQLDKMGRTELHYAALNKDLEIVKKLLEEGYDVNAKDKSGVTPLHFAAQSQSSEVVKFLIDSGAHVNTADEHGNTPLFNAIFNYRTDGSVIELLKQHGADPYMKNKYDQSPIGLARLIANYDVSKFFKDMP